MRVPLRIHVLFQPPERAPDAPPSEAERLAGLLYDTFSAKPTGRATRIPVRFSVQAADDADVATLFEDADHAVVIALVDEHMTLGGGPAAVRARWEQRVLALRAACARKSGHVFLPIAVDADAFDLSNTLAETSFVRLEHRRGSDRDQHLVLHVVTRAFRALQGERASPDCDEVPEAPVQVFMSHAKQDLGSGYADGPVKSLLAVGAQGPVQTWYDAAKIDAGTSFRRAIEQGVAGSVVLVAVITDAWSDREWCRRELLLAKQLRAPIVVVNAFDQGCQRLFPYVGNAPIVSWRASALPKVHPEDAGQVHAWCLQQRDRLVAEDAGKVLVTALTEALRHRCERLRLGGYASSSDATLADPPEALTLASMADRTRIWYPDPPLGREELDAVRGDHPRERFLTPLSSLARWARPAAVDMVAVSLSGSPDSVRYGGSPKHLATLAEDLVVYLLIAGLKVCYGGVIGHGALTKGAVDGDEIDYVKKLCAQARSHAPLAADIEGGRFHPIHNVVAWPLHLTYGPKDYRAYGKEAVLFQLPAPPGVAGAGATPLADHAARCRSLTWMRTLQITGGGEAIRSSGDVKVPLPPTSARVALGGKLAGSVSRYPGVLEEILLSLRAQQPLYLVGTFGGATRLVVDVLLGAEREELTTGWFEEHHLPDRNGTSWQKLVGWYREAGLDIETPEELRDELAGYRELGIARALNNGLSDEENRDLVGCDDPQRAIGLILRGLQTRFPEGSGMASTTP